MADSFIQVPADSTGKKVDTSSLTVGANTVQRQRFQIAGATDTALAPVDATNGLAVDAKTLAPDAATQTTLAVVASNTLDYDTGAGTDTQCILGIALPASGGAVAGGTNTNPIQVGDAGGSLTVDVGTALPAGAALIGKVGIDQTTPGTTNGVQVNAALPAGANAIGKLAANSGVTIGAVEIAAAQTLATVTTVGAVTTLTNALPAGSNLIGNVGDGKTHKSKTGSASATFTIIAAVSSKKLKAYRLSLMMTSASAVTVTFKDGASGTAIGTYLLQAPANVVAGIAEAVSVPSSLFETTAGNLLEMAFSAAVSVTYNLSYWDDDAT